jgi:alpha-glucosidase
MFVSRRRLLLGGAAIISAFPRIGWAGGVDPRIAVRSPDGKAEVVVDLSGARPRWSVAYDDREILAPSELALILKDGGRLGEGARLQGVERKNYTGQWSPAFGSSASYDESHNEATIRLFDAGRRIALNIVARAYDAGVAIRYQLAEAAGGRVTFSGEATQFRFPAGAKVYASRDEGEYQVSAPAGLDPVVDPPLTESADRGALADVPVTVDAGNGIFALLTEANRLNYPRMMIRPRGDALESYMMQYPGRASGWGGPGLTPAEPDFTLAVGQATPWRVLALADHAAGLIETYGLIPSLAEPNRLGDVSWVRPGRAVRIRAPYSTAASLVCVDFAAKHKLDYVEYDAHWYGDGTDSSDASYPIAALDLKQVIAYAAARHIGVILYVDRVPVARQLAQICQAYQDWGVKGVKFGFVWEGRQSDNVFVQKIIETCAAHRLLVNLHDDLRPSGLERTYPNYIAMEGVRGNEHFPTPRHNVTLPFTRSVAGPLDYTICYANSRNQTTNAHQLAMAAVYYNPLTFLYWYDAPEKYATKPWPELRWFDECPTTWDETRALDGRIGEHVLVARRHGRRWFVGAMTNEEGRTLKLDLAFLGQGAWRADIFRDGEPAVPAYRTEVVIEAREVDRSTVMDLHLNPCGGQAILLTPKDLA